MTRKRLAVLAALESLDAPASASDIAKVVGTECDLATVYRALHGLEAQGKADAFVFECSERGTERYYLARRSAHRHFFHCERCHCFIDLGECRLGPLVEAAQKEHGVRIEGHTLYFTGVCAGCSTRGSAARAAAPVSAQAGAPAAAANAPESRDAPRGSSRPAPGSRHPGRD